MSMRLADYIRARSEDGERMEKAEGYDILTGAEDEDESEAVSE